MSVVKQFGIGMAIILMTIFLFVTADKIYGDIASQMKTLMLTYLLLLICTQLFFKQELPTATAGIMDVLFGLGSFFITGLILMSVPIIKSLVSTGTITLAAFGGTSFLFTLAFLFIQAFVIAYIETIVFQGAIPQILGVISPISLSAVLSQILFGLFHYGAIGKNLPLAVALFMLGMVWLSINLFVSRQYGKSAGVFAAAGSHFAWNLFALGILQTMF